ncbi:pesticidal protein Cry7Aa [Patescibacteria group bacterium]|nr:pesticidal protein Cry7Aa [Patescibacteria group bacterium]
MINVLKQGKILEKTNHHFENGAVLNPACIIKDGITHMFYRAIDHLGISTIGYCQIKNDKVIYRHDQPLLKPDFPYERQGLEDPRIVFLDGTYYLFYTAYDGQNALVAYATSMDLVHFSKHGVISPKITYDEAEDLFRNSHIKEEYVFFETFYKDKLGKNVLLWEKDAFIFPKKFHGQLAMFHRILPGIQLIYFNDFTELTDQYWRSYLKNLGSSVVLEPRYYFESRNIGGGCPVIETEAGWLLIYHAVEDSGQGRIYHAGAALLDLHDPSRVLHRLSEPLFSPTQAWEKNSYINNPEGNVNSVVFPSGAIVEGDELTIYYGAADFLIAYKTIKLSDLINLLKNSQV